METSFWSCWNLINHVKPLQPLNTGFDFKKRKKEEKKTDPHNSVVIINMHYQLDLILCFLQQNSLNIQCSITKPACGTAPVCHTGRNGTSGDIIILWLMHRRDHEFSLPHGPLIISRCRNRYIWWENRQLSWVSRCPLNSVTIFP